MTICIPRSCCPQELADDVLRDASAVTGVPAVDYLSGGRFGGVSHYVPG